MKRFQAFILFFSLILAFPALSQSIEGRVGSKKAILVIHGGAGTMSKESLTKEKREELTEILGKALLKGHRLIKKGKSSEEAIIAAIMTLEDDPNFNAGKGSVLNEEGNVEMDASIMNGKDMKAGAVAGIKRIKNPILAAQAVKDYSEHVLLSGEGAEVFAKSQKLSLEDPKYFITEKKKARWEKMKQNDNSSGMLNHMDSEGKYGTVGAVAIDNEGNISAGTSTGGMMMKKLGRIGDSPIIGAGTYANNKSCGVSCTGHGEYFIRYNVAARISALMELKNLSIKEAADKVINKTLVEAGGSGGVIAIDKNGNYAFAFNTPGMYRGVVFEDGTIEIRIFKVE